MCCAHCCRYSNETQAMVKRPGGPRNVFHPSRVNENGNLYYKDEQDIFFLHFP